MLMAPLSGRASTDATHRLLGESPTQIRKPWYRGTSFQFIFPASSIQQPPHLHPEGLGEARQRAEGRVVLARLGP